MHKNIFVNLPVKDLARSVEFFISFIPNPVSDAEEVNELTSRALAAGATQHKKPSDLDGHFWEPFWMDPTHVQ